MINDREAERLFKAGLKARRAGNAFKEKLAAELARDRRRRDAVASRFRQRLYEKAMRAAGVDPTEVRRRQEADHAARAAVVKKLMPGVKANVAAVARAHEARAKLVTQRFASSPLPPPSPPPPPGPPPAPYDVQLLVKANDSHVTADGGTNATMSLASWNNTLSAEVILNDSGYGVAAGEFVFNYGPFKSGFVKAWAFASANGSLSWNTHGTCWDGAFVSGGAGASLTLQQFAIDGSLNQDSVTATLDTVLHSYGQDEHCLGDSGIDVFDGFQVIELPAYFPVLGNRLMQAVVSASAFVQSSNGGGDVDFLNSGRNINVIGVALQFFA